jgi:N6-L-threonylcarbamoyladenine synthase
VVFPALALLISGGHTELVLIHDWMKYEVIGKTRDDAVGEAFDKVARLLSLPYPGGPEISKLAHDARIAHTTPSITLPRPMIKSPDYDFSFSGIKTSVLYKIQELTRPSEDLGHPLFIKERVGASSELSDNIKKEFALEFENAVTEVLISKTKKALENYEIKTLILGGGVIANTYIRAEFEKLIKDHPDTTLLIPDKHLATDNAVMIAAAGYINFLNGVKESIDIKANGNLSFDSK